MSGIAPEPGQSREADGTSTVSVWSSLPNPHRVVAALALSMFFAAACHPSIKSTLPGPPSPKQMAELWIEPGTRDLYWGVGGNKLVPDPVAAFTVIEIKHRGFSRGYTVKGQDDREWSVKFPPEAPTEVVASRILWGVGYHQPPIYYVGKWMARKAPSPNPQLPARFREKDPMVEGRFRLQDRGTWSYYRNPFVGTRELKGLLVLHAMLGNSDLKDQNNARYELPEAAEGASVWYVARDLGHTLGRTGILNAPRGDVEVFEKTPFIKGLVNGRVKLDWRGLHDPLFEDIAPADVRWICERLSRLQDAQWDAAFRAGGYPKEEADRYIRRLKQKIAEGLALKG